METLGSSEFWLGGTKVTSYATWLWMDRTAMNYSHWENGKAKNRASFAKFLLA